MKPFVKELKLTTFNNEEESAEALNEKPPFSLDIRLTFLGALYNKGQNIKIKL